MKNSLLVFVLLFLALLGNTLNGRDLHRVGSPDPWPTPTPDSIAAITETLIAHAVKDFREHQPPLPVKFRKVRIGHLVNAEGSPSYRLCGEFLPSDGDGGKPEWVQFATIKTSGYEQWIGTSGLGQCSDKKMIWAKTGDLSSLMKKELDSTSPK